jgi:hypothetical protein
LIRPHPSSEEILDAFSKWAVHCGFQESPLPVPIVATSVLDVMLQVLFLLPQDFAMLLREGWFLCWISHVLQISYRFAMSGTRDVLFDFFLDETFIKPFSARVELRQTFGI